MGRRTHHSQDKRHTNLGFLIKNTVPKQHFILSVPWPHALLLLYLTDIILSILRKFCKSLFLTLVTPSLVLGDPALRPCLKPNPLSSFWKLAFCFNTNSQSFLKSSYLSTQIFNWKNPSYGGNQLSIQWPHFFFENWSKKVCLFLVKKYSWAAKIAQWLNACSSCNSQLLHYGSQLYTTSALEDPMPSFVSMGTSMNMVHRHTYKENIQAQNRSFLSILKKNTISWKYILDTFLMILVN